MGRKRTRKPSKTAQREARRAEVAAEATTRTCPCPAWAPHLPSCRFAQPDTIEALDQILEQNSKEEVKTEVKDELSESQFQ